MNYELEPPTSPTSPVEEQTPISTPPSIHDESAFPALGNSLPKRSGSSTPVSIRSRNVQETFVIQGEQQVNISKPELAKILTRLKTQYKVSIESTFSANTNKRTFLLSGPAEPLKIVKREILKQLTKPVTVQFSIPSKLRSAVIGSGGSVLRPILDQTKVKIDISREPISATDSEPDIGAEFGDPVLVTITGDLEGCTHAKSMILAIVDENTRTLETKVNLSAKVKPFAQAALAELAVPQQVEVLCPSYLDHSSGILISGPRDEAFAVKQKVSALLSKVESSIETQSFSVPMALHQFLNKDLIFQQTGVIIELPPQDSEKPSVVSFTGAGGNIKDAVALGKSMAANYSTFDLDLGRAHSNPQHAKNLTAFLVFSHFFENLSKDSGVSIITPQYSYLASSSEPVIRVPLAAESAEQLQSAKRQIIARCNIFPVQTIRKVDGIDPLVLDGLDQSVARDNDVTVVPLGKFSSTDSVLLVANRDEDDFAPSPESIDDRLNKAEASLAALKELTKSLVTKNVDVPANQQYHIKRGLDKVVSSFPKAQVTYGPHSIAVRGPSDSVSQLVAEMDKLVEQLANYEEAVKYNDSTRFPKQLVSRFIGQRGANLNALKEECNVKIDVNDAENEAIITVTGLKANVDECLAKVNAMNKKFSDEKSVTLNIDPQFHKKLIGPGGSYANKLREKYNVSIHFGDDVTIKGPSRGVTKAQEEITELLEYEKSNGFKSVVPVPVAALPKVIGKGGENIKDICDDLGVEIHFDRSTEKSGGFANMEIVGSRTGIQKAEAKVKEIVDKVENFTSVSVEVDPKYHGTIIGPNGSNLRTILEKAGAPQNDRLEWRRFLQVPQKNSNSTEIVCAGDKNVVEKIVAQVKELVSQLENTISDSVEVPKPKQKLIVGPMGSIRRELQTEFNVQIEVPKLESESVLVKVSGLTENVEKAKTKILDLTK